MQLDAQVIYWLILLKIQFSQKYPNNQAAGEAHATATELHRCRKMLHHHLVSKIPVIIYAATGWTKVSIDKRIGQ